jgi:hypothetical protein
MKQYHYSAKVKDSESFYHGVFETKLTDLEKILEVARGHLSKKLSAWTLKNEDVVWIDIYFYDNLKENIIFHWELNK